jgi:hypothetical protein
MNQRCWTKTLAGLAVAAVLTAVPVLALVCFGASSLAALGQDLPALDAEQARSASRLLPLDRPVPPATEQARRAGDDVTYLSTWTYTHHPSPGH